MTDPREEIKRLADALADALDAKRLNWLLANCTQEVTPNGDLGLRFNCDFEHYDDVRGAIDSAMFPPTDSREKQVNVAAQGTAPKGQAVGLTPVAATPTQPETGWLRSLACSESVPAQLPFRSWIAAVVGSRSSCFEWFTASDIERRMFLLFVAEDIEERDEFYGDVP